MAKRVKDSGWDRRIKRLLRRTTVTIGIHQAEGARSDGQLTNAQIGTWMEFGTSRVPQRSFLRSTFDNNAPEYVRALTLLRRRNIFRSPKVSAEIWGQKIASDVKARIRSGIPPQLAASTVRQKGSTTPLINTAQMLNSISSEVR